MNQIELEKIADYFDRDHDGFIDLSEINSILRGIRRARSLAKRRPVTDSEKIDRAVRDEPLHNHHTTTTQPLHNHYTTTIQPLHIQQPLSYSICDSYSLHLQIELQVSRCCCSKKFRVIRVAEGQYRVSTLAYIINIFLYLHQVTCM